MTKRFGTKKTISTLILSCFAFLCCLFGGIFSTGSDMVVTNPTVSANFVGSGGTGTSSDPYLISDVDDLQELRDAVNAGNDFSGEYFIQTANIDLDGLLWTPIGCIAEGYPFSGIYDGQNYKISNLTLYDEQYFEGEGIGLFGQTYEATIRNIHIVGVTCSFGSSIYELGSVVGYAMYTKIFNCIVENLMLDGYMHVGGIVGRLYGTSDVISEVAYCQVIGGTIEAYASEAGGIVGELYNTASSADYIEINHCYSDATVYGGAVDVNDGSTGYAGGIVGYVYGCSDVMYCTNDGSILGTSYVGGIVGKAVGASDANDTYITGCCNYGSVENTCKVGSYAFGGIAGYLGGFTNVYDSYNKAGVAADENVAGGLVGIIDADSQYTTWINKSYNAGSLYGQAHVAGGIVGEIEGGSVGIQDVICVANDYTGSTTTVGGIVGANSGSLKLIRAYYDSSKFEEIVGSGTATNSSSGGYGWADEIIKDEAQFLNYFGTAWGLSNTGTLKLAPYTGTGRWRIDPNVNGGYPIYTYNNYNGISYVDTRGATLNNGNFSKVSDNIYRGQEALGNDYTDLSNLDRTGYTFKGWRKNLYDISIKSMYMLANGSASGRSYALVNRPDGNAFSMSITTAQSSDVAFLFNNMVVQPNAITVGKAYRLQVDVLEFSSTGRVTMCLGEGQFSNECEFEIDGVDTHFSNLIGTKTTVLSSFLNGYVSVESGATMSIVFRVSVYDITEGNDTGEWVTLENVNIIAWYEPVRVNVDFDATNFFADHGQPYFYNITGTYSQSSSGGVKTTSVKFTSSAQSTGYAYGFYIPGTSTVSSDTGHNYFTWSIEVKASTAVTISSFGYEQGGLRSNVNVTTQWQTITHSFNLSSNINKAFVFYSANFKSGMTISFRNLVLQDYYKLKGTGAIPSRSFYFGEENISMPVPTRSGWDFQGWFHKHTFTHTYDASCFNSNVYRFFENNGKTYGGGTLNIGDRVYMDITFSSTAKLTSVDINDVTLTKNTHYTVEGNHVIIDFKISNMSYIGQYSFIDINFSSTSGVTYTMDEFYFMINYTDCDGELTRTWDIASSVTLYSYWLPIKADVTVYFKFEDDISFNTITGSGYDADFVSGFSCTISYSSSTPVIGDPDSLQSVTKDIGITSSAGVSFNDVSDGTPISFDNFIIPDGWFMVGVSESHNGSSMGVIDYRYVNSEVRNSYYTYAERTHYISFCFKKVSDNQMKYDAVDKYLYFEDGEFPQTAVVTYDEAFNNLLTNLTEENSFTQKVNGREIEFKTLTYKHVADDLTTAPNSASYDGQRFMGFEMPTTRTVNLKYDNAIERTFTAGHMYWFRYDPIRWRVSDYGYVEDNVSYCGLTQGKGWKNFPVVSDVLWIDALNESSNTAFGVGSDATQTSLMQNLANNTLLDGDSMNLEYSNMGMGAVWDQFNNTADSNDKVVGAGGYWNDAIEMRYLRFTSNGNNVNQYNHMTFIKIQYHNGLYKMVADATTDLMPTVYSGSLSDSGSYFSTSQTFAIDLGRLLKIGGVCYWKYGDRTYYGQKIEYSKDGTIWYTYWDSQNKGSYGNHDDTNLYQESSEGRLFCNGRARVASIEEIYGTGQIYTNGNTRFKKLQNDLRCYASQLVCALLGCDQTEYVEYWTRDFGQQLGCGTYVTSSGEIMKNTWMTKSKGVRFCTGMSEASVIYPDMDGFYECGSGVTSTGTNLTFKSTADYSMTLTNSGTYDGTTTHSQAYVDLPNYYGTSHRPYLEAGKKYVFIIDATLVKGVECENANLKFYYYNSTYAKDESRSVTVYIEKGHAVLTATVSGQFQLMVENNYTRSAGGIVEVDYLFKEI